ncbi:MAG: metallophosphoesterase family protein [Anaerolineae bacterium]|nr:metallophosphoesterase family protein [Anaerolineae bacterium]
MRIAVLSDIHGNSIALDAVLEDIQAQGPADAYWVLGDLAAIGFDPIGVLERMADLPQARLVRGNTDRFLVTGERPSPTVEECEVNPALWPARAEIAASFSWTQGMVTATGWMEWLAKLPLESRTVLQNGTRVLCVHASPGCDDGREVRPGVSKEALRSLAAESEAGLVFVGHTHWPMETRVDGVHLANVGSVSNAFPPDLRAGYVMLEADETGYALQYRRVAYDREAVVRELRRVNHPAAPYIIRFLRGEIRPNWWKTGP